MLSEKVELSSIKVNKKNPRKIDKMQFDSLVKSILVFPKMLNDLRPIVVDEFFINLAINFTGFIVGWSAFL